MRADEADELGHANNVIYLRWILDAAIGHWNWLKGKVDPAVLRDVAWVVLRHEVDYLAPAFPGETIEVTTWVPTCTPTTCARFAEIRRPADDVLLARSASTYVVVDAASGRPRRLTDALRVAIGNPAEVRRPKADRPFPARPDRCVEAG